MRASLLHLGLMGAFSHGILIATLSKVKHLLLIIKLPNYLFLHLGLMSQRVFHTNGLMRMRLTPDCNKMVLCTAGGYIMVIHNLDLTMLSQDLCGFKPNMYRLMQISQTPISLATNFSHLFTSKRNRVELISDWPAGNEAEVISALHVHPLGWCKALFILLSFLYSDCAQTTRPNKLNLSVCCKGVVSRNTSNLDKSEWTCVHDIQDVPVDAQAIPNKRPRLDSDSTMPSTSYQVFSSSSSSSSNSSDDEAQSSPNTDNNFTAPQVQFFFCFP